MDTETFALVQESLDRIPIGVLEEALSGVDGLTPLDTAHLNGVKVAVVRQADVPEIPPTKRLHQLEHDLKIL
jgi:hypothetical protein